MDPKLQPVSISGRPMPLPGGTDSLAAERNRVLRNTYWLLALSLLPVVAGAWLGMRLDFVSYFKAAPIMTPLVMFAAMLGMLFAVTLLRNSAWGVAALFGFTFVSGVFLTPILSVAAGLRNGGQLVALAGGMTAAIFFAMATIATVTKRDFGFMGKFLFIGLILLVVASLANVFFQVPALSLTISAIAVLLFSAYLLFDVSRIVNGGETNYVMATLNIFLNLYNIFISLLNLLMAFTGQRD
ncbi:MAG TPA: Bax inhibitor-1/YccA family protein [Casimicrobiaceae bacterium]|jgi:modulator of FtsH protease|nr:Bax inhibitor-1/YccA family protein [Casimicrobiaceae bacterium]